MSTLPFWLAAPALMLLCVGCATPLRPDESAIRPWTAELSAEQPDDAFAAVYARDGVRLVFIGALHSNRADSRTFRLIDEACESFRFAVLIAEGFPYGWGANPQSILEIVNQSAEVDGFVSDGEFMPAARCALLQRAQIRGGEPDDGELLVRVLQRGHSHEDLLGFYTLRLVPQWIREERINGTDDVRVDLLLEAELEYSRRTLGLDGSVLPNVSAWRTWYKQTNGKPFGSAFDLEEVGPRTDGQYASSQIAAAIGDVRGAFVLEKIAKFLNGGESVMVVFGSSHLMKLRPAIDRMLGAPCYVGERMQDAAGVC